MLRIEFEQRTHVGMQRQENQDSMGHFEGALGHLYTVCDGMGGHAGGQIASTLAVKAIGDFYQNITAGSDPNEALKGCVEAANSAVYQRSVQEPELRGMGTTCVAMLVSKDCSEARVAHVGDSRIYRIVSGEIELLTRDHTAVQVLIDRGIITLEQAISHPRAHVINRSLGVLESVDVELGKKVLVFKDGERYLLCSDGLTTMIEDLDIYDHVAKHPIESVCDELINVSNAKGGYDNVTVQVLQIGAALPLKAGAHLTFQPSPPPIQPAQVSVQSGWNWTIVMVVAAVSVFTLLAIIISILT